MTAAHDRMALIEMVEKQADGDLVREVLVGATGPPETETFWTDLLRTLADRGPAAIILPL